MWMPNFLSGRAYPEPGSLEYRRPAIVGLGALLQAGQQLLGAVDGDRKPNADVPFDGALDRLVDADQGALAVEECAPGIPRVDGGVGLDQAGETAAVLSG